MGCRRLLEPFLASLGRDREFSSILPLEVRFHHFSSLPTAPYIEGCQTAQEQGCFSAPDSEAMDGVRILSIGVFVIASPESFVQDFWQWALGTKGDFHVAKMATMFDGGCHNLQSSLVSASQFFSCDFHNLSLSNFAKILYRLFIGHEAAAFYTAGKFYDRFVSLLEPTNFQSNT
jgi:hypothetical protein